MVLKDDKQQRLNDDKISKLAEENYDLWITVCIINQFNIKGLFFRCRHTSPTGEFLWSVDEMAISLHYLLFLFSKNAWPVIGLPSIIHL